MSYNSKSTIGNLQYNDGNDNDSSVVIHKSQDGSQKILQSQDSSWKVLQSQDSSQKIYSDRSKFVSMLKPTNIGWNNVAIDSGNGIKEATNAEFNDGIGTTTPAKQLEINNVSSVPISMDTELSFNAMYILFSAMVYSQSEFDMKTLQETIPIYVPPIADVTDGVYIPKIPIPITIKIADNGTDKVSTLNQVTVPMIYKNPNNYDPEKWRQRSYHSGTSFIGSTASDTHIVSHTGQDNLAPGTPTSITTRKFKGSNHNSQIASFGLNAKAFPSGMSTGHFVISSYRLRLKNKWHDYNVVSHFNEDGTVTPDANDAIEASPLMNLWLAAEVGGIIAAGTTFAVVNIWNPAGWVVAIVTAVAGIVSILASYFGIDWTDVFDWPKHKYSGINGIEINSIRIYGEGQDPAIDKPKYKYYIDHRGHYTYYHDRGIFYNGYWTKRKRGWVKKSEKRKTDTDSCVGLAECQFRIRLAPNNEVASGTSEWLSGLTMSFLLNDDEEEVTFLAPSDLSIDYTGTSCHIEENDIDGLDNIQLRSYLKDSEGSKYLTRNTNAACIYVDTTQFADNKGFSINMKLYPLEATRLEASSGITGGDYITYIGIPDSIGPGYETVPKIPISHNTTCKITTKISDKSLRTTNPNIQRLAYLFSGTYLIAVSNLSSNTSIVLGLEVDNEYILPDNLIDSSKLLTEYLQDNNNIQINNINIISSNKLDIQIVLGITNINSNNNIYIYIKYTKVSNYNSSIYIKDNIQREEYILSIYPLEQENIESNRPIEYLSFPNDDNFRKRNISLYVNDNNLLYKEPLDYSLLMSHGGLSWVCSKKFLGEAFGRIEDTIALATGGYMIPYKLPYLHIPVIYPNFKSENVTPSGTDDQKILTVVTEVARHMGYDYDAMPYTDPQPLSIGWVTVPSVSPDTRAYNALPEKVIDFLNIDNLEMLNYIATDIITLGKEQYCIVNELLYKKSKLFNLMAANTAPIVKEKGQFYAIANFLVASTNDYTAVYMSNDFELRFLYTVPAKTVASPIIANGKILLVSTIGMYLLDQSDSVLIYRFSSNIIRGNIRTLGTDSFILITERVGDQFLYSPGDVKLTYDLGGEPESLTVNGNVHSVYKISDQFSISELVWNDYNDMYISDFSDNIGSDLFVISNNIASKLETTETEYNTYKLKSRMIKFDSISLDDPVIQSIRLYTNSKNSNDISITIYTGIDIHDFVFRIRSGYRQIDLPVNCTIHGMCYIELEIEKTCQLVNDIKIKIGE